MYTKEALIIAGIVFGFVAFMHLLRLILKVEIIIAGKIVPMWASIIGFIFPLALSFWMFMANGGLG